MVKYILKLALFALLSSFSLNSLALNFYSGTGTGHIRCKNSTEPSFSTSTNYPGTGCTIGEKSSGDRCGFIGTFPVSCGSNTYYKTIPSGTCPANSTHNPTTGMCSPNEGFSAVRTGTMSNSTHGSFAVVPAGSECSGGKIYNPTNGLCENPTCTTDQKRLVHQHSLTGLSDVSNLFPINTCSNGCQYTISSGSTSDCFLSFAGSSEKNVYCPADYTGTAQTCTTSTALTTPPSEPTQTTCGNNQLRNDAGICEDVALCAPDQIRDNGLCVNTACQPGYTRVNDYGSCVAIVQCTSPQIRDTITNTCYTPPPAPCPTGQYRDINTNQCYANPTYDQSCPAGMQKDVQGFCTRITEETPPITSGQNFDGSTDHDGNPNTAGSNEPGRPGSNKNIDGSPNTDGNPQTVNDPPVACTGFDCEEPQDQGTCSPSSPTWNAETQTCGSTGSSQVTGDNELGYQKGDSTFDGVLTDFTSKLNNTPVFKAANSFLGLNIQSVQCPVFEQQIMQGFLGQQGFIIRVDQHCSDFADDVFPIMEAVLMAVAAFVAFRWAVL